MLRVKAPPRNELHLPQVPVFLEEFSGHIPCSKNPVAAGSQGKLSSITFNGPASCTEKREDVRDA